MTATATLTIAGRRIGPPHPCYVIAEAGVNHNGRPELAHALVDAAADAGADAVKFQTFDATALAHPDAPRALYQQRNLGEDGSQLSMLQRLELPRDAHAALREHAHLRGIEFLSTPFDTGSADFLEALGVPAFKISSGDLNNPLLLRHVARKNRPILLSSGMAALGEVERAIAVVAEVSSAPVAVFHCVSSYPAALADCNLKAIPVMQDALQVPVGFSDHTTTDVAALVAVALGAAMIEKHLTLDTAMDGPDHAASFDPPRLRQLVAAIRDAASSLGTGVKVPAASEQDARRVVRRSLYWARAISRGDVIAETDLIAMRPSGGISPEDWRTVVGRHARRDVAARARVQPDDVE